MNLSHHRLTSIDQLEPYKQSMTPDEYFKFARRVYDRLAAMNPGDTFNIKTKVSEENRDLFIKIACCYIFDFPGLAIFNDTFTVITRPQTPSLNSSQTLTTKKTAENEQ